MDINFKRFTSDAATAFNRALQLTEEKFGVSSKTELDSHIETLIHRAENTEEHTKKLVSCIESYLQPNPTIRMEEFFTEKLELRKEQRPNNLEYLGMALIEAGACFGPTAYGSVLVNVGETQQKLGSAERDFVQSVATNVLSVLKRFLDSDMRTIAKERKILSNKRLDLDACKTRLKKAKTLEAQANADADLRIAQSEFDKQLEILKLLLEGVQTAHNNHLTCLRDFVEAQVTFYAQAHQQMVDLQRDLSGALSGDRFGLNSHSKQ